MTRARKVAAPERVTLRDIGAPRSFRTHSLGGRKVEWTHTVRNAWALDQTSARYPFAAASATPQDGVSREMLSRERDALGRYRQATAIGTPTHSVQYTEARYGKAQHKVSASDLPNVSLDS